MANNVTFPAKDPAAVLDYAFDWTAWLATGETISSVVFDVEDGLTPTNPTHDDETAVVWISGGTDDENYSIGCKIVTSAGRTEVRSRRLPVKER